MNANDTLLVVDLLASKVNEWAEAVLTLQQKDTKPFHSYVGIYTDEEAFSYARSQLQERLMAEWWPQQPDAGPLLPSRKDVDEIGRPMLKIIAWVDGRSTMPASARDRFPQWSDVHAAWEQKLNAASKQFPETRPCAGEKPSGSGTLSSPIIAGPCYDTDPPADVADVVELETKSVEELEGHQRLGAYLPAVFL